MHTHLYEPSNKHIREGVRWIIACIYKLIVIVIIRPVRIKKINAKSFIVHYFHVVSGSSTNLRAFRVQKNVV